MSNTPDDSRNLSEKDDQLGFDGADKQEAQVGKGALEQRLERLETALAGLQNSKSQEEDVAKKIQSQFLALNAKIEDIESQMQMLRKEQKDDSKLEAPEVLATVEEVNNSLKRLREEQGVLKSEIASLNSDVDVVKEDGESISSTLDDLYNDVENLKSFARGEETKAVNVEELKELRRNLELSREEQEKMSSIVIDLSSELKTVKGEKEKEDEEMKALLESNIFEVKTKTEANVKRLRKHLKQMETELVKVQAKNKLYDRSVQSLEILRSILNEKVNATKKDKTALVPVNNARANAPMINNFGVRVLVVCIARSGMNCNLNFHGGVNLTLGNECRVTVPVTGPYFVSLTTYEGHTNLYRRKDSSIELNDGVMVIKGENQPPPFTEFKIVCLQAGEEIYDLQPSGGQPNFSLTVFCVGLCTL